MTATPRRTKIMTKRTVASDGEVWSASDDGMYIPVEFLETQPCSKNWTRGNLFCIRYGSRVQLGVNLVLHNPWVNRKRLPVSPAHPRHRCSLPDSRSNPLGRPRIFRRTSGARGTSSSILSHISFCCYCAHFWKPIRRQCKKRQIHKVY